MNVFITGIGGFVGGAVAQALVGVGANVVGLVRSVNEPSNPKLMSECKIYVGDVCDFDLMSEIISRNEIDVIYHFAAYSIVRVSARDPRSTYAINIMGTVNLLEAARQVGKCNRIIVASSDKAYGEHETLPYMEDFPLLPKNTYDVSKACMDLISQSYGTNHGLPVIVTRCANIYGPGDSNTSRVIPGTILRLMNGMKPMLYSDIEGMEREFIYIDDVVDAYLRLAELKCHPGMVFNIGANNPIRISELVKKICILMGKGDVELDIVERDPEFKEIQSQSIDGSLLMETTCWEPKVDLDEGLERTIKYYLEL
jgi:CDP-glucose 4,6-dehydratase